MSLQTRNQALATAVGADIKSLTKQMRLAASPNYAPRLSLSGPATTDTTTLSLGITQDAAYDRSYAIASNTLPADWPVSAFGKMTSTGNTFMAKTYNDAVASVTTYRMMCDGAGMQLFTTTQGFTMDLFIDGQPHPSNPITLGTTSGYGTYGWQKLVWGAAKPEGRLIEIRTLAGLVAVYAAKPYRLWKPAPDHNPSIAVVGDSYVYPLVMDNTVAGPAAGDTFLPGLYQSMPKLLGISRLATDGYGGSGYLAGAAAGRPYSHAERIAWLDTVAADVEIIHGGGANDFYNSFSAAAIEAAVIAYFTARRAARPNAKLVFMEGFSPPGFPGASYNPAYITLRQNVQTALNAAGVGVYYIDVATTAPPLVGSGYVTATSGNENSNIYVGSDGFHLTTLGHRFARGFLASKIARVLADDGNLVGTLI